MSNTAIAKEFTAQDFTSDQEIRWCPGCGDYAIVKGVRKALAEIGTPPENVAFVSGIGCAARFPYYMSTYGFHTIHGRAPAFATGLKLANPDLDVWVVGGDGDMLSIGGNHTFHVMRRNVDLNLLLFNNEIYGLTKGQYSPTSEEGTRSPSTPFGSLDHPVSPVSFALGVGGRFVARAYDIGQKTLPEVLKRAQGHKGASFVEILQNCHVYNDGTFEEVRDKGSINNQLICSDGEPLIFGKERDRGIILNREKLALEVVNIGQDGIEEKDILIHDEKNKNIAIMLGELKPPNGPMAFGVIYANPTESYNAAMFAQDEELKKQAGHSDLNQLLRRGHTWMVE
ncbi:MAG: 2-oxoacid:ferredoxin oxidoreductase subunit beta [Gammaproteobacteria bacterium]|jgi:2-oxoglutarate ferredoxin oxidoreductase subunit beta|nr:2-oxoacid:ferredoxin oxidoreductase subunit beta [Gammaproteobacteria bacterium]|tara:strand:+ start:316 stop:1338 length:1023 start_codon:yes stop_codon:yes gene_type:complete